MIISNKEAVKGSLTISAFNALGAGSAFLVDVMVAARFGLSRETDAFFVALTIPQLIFSILMVACNVTLVPLFTSVLIERGQEEMWRFLSLLANLSLLFLGSLAMIGVIFSPFIVRIIAPGLEPATSQLAIQLNMLLSLTIITAGLIEVLRASLNALHIFAIPASVPMLRNLAVFLGVIFLAKSMGIQALVVGNIASAIFPVLLLLVMLLYKGYRYQPLIDVHDPRVRETWRLLQPPLLGSVLGQSNILAERFLVSFLPVGMVSALVYARRVMHAVDTVFLTSVSTAFLPRLSAQSVVKNITEFKRSLALGVKLTAFLALPVVAVLMVLNLPVVRLFFQRGAFSLQAAGITASIMTLYMIGIVPMAALQMLTASYYAFQDTRTPLYIRLFMLAINLVLDLLLLQIMSAKGLALALSLSRLITVVGAFWLLQRTIGAIRNNLDRFFVKLSMATLAMGATMILLRRTLERGVIPSTFLGLLVEVGVVALAGILIYNLAVILLRVEEVERVLDLVRAKALNKVV